jgi:limonene-1,2-epoxide hydrolase
MADSTESGNTEQVLAFVAAWSRNDVDELMSYFAPDAIYHNIPVEPVTGSDAIRKTIEGFSAMAQEIEWVTHQVAENEAGVVLTERTDRFKIAGNWIEIPVMGSFELHAGKITAWRDYFDMNQFTSQLPGAA